MTREPTETELRAANALLREVTMAAGSPPVTNALDMLSRGNRDRVLCQVRAVIRSLRDMPHSVLDLARGSKMASGDAAVFVNSFIDTVSPPESS